MALSVLSFGLVGLFHKGGNAMLKAGDVLTGYVAPSAPPAEPMPAEAAPAS